MAVVAHPARQGMPGVPCTRLHLAVVRRGVAGNHGVVTSSGRDAWAAFRADVAAMTGRGGRVRRVVLAVLLPQVRAVAYYRVGHALAARGRVGLAVAFWLRGRAVARSGAEIHPHAVIGPGLNLVHPVGVVVGGGVTIGARCWIYQGVTLGHGGRPGQPTLGDGVHVGAGASVLGGVVVGDGARVGAGAVVVGDVPAGETARGVPAVVRGLGRVV